MNRRFACCIYGETTLELSLKTNHINNECTFIILLVAKYVCLLKKFQNKHFTHAICKMHVILSLVMNRKS